MKYLFDVAAVVLNGTLVYLGNIYLLHNPPVAVICFVIGMIYWVWIRPNDEK